MPVFLKKKKCKFLNFSKRKASSYKQHKTDGDAAATDDEAAIKGYVPIPIPENASIEERLDIFQKNSTAYHENMRKALAEDRRRLDEFMISVKRLKLGPQQTQGELERQEPAREEVVSETNLPIGGNQPKGLIFESQPYIEAVHGEEDPEDCSSDENIVSEQISNFSADQAKYVAVDQMHGGQDMTHDHPFDQEKLATVGDKADLGTSSSPKLQLKIIIRQPTKILGGQGYSSCEPNCFQFFDAKYLCSFPTSSHKMDFHVINFDTSEFRVKHRWPPP